MAHSVEQIFSPYMPQLQDAYHQGKQMIIGVDGRSGSGKSTCASHLVDYLHTQGFCAHSVELENHIEGWNGLEAGCATLARDVLPDFLRRGIFSARRWNWHTSQWEAEKDEFTTRILVLTGCGSTSAAIAPLLELSIWIDVPAQDRHRRVCRREGDAGYVSQWWDAWARQEEKLLSERNSAVVNNIILRG